MRLRDVVCAVFNFFHEVYNSILAIVFVCFDIFSHFFKTFFPVKYTVSLFPIDQKERMIAVRCEKYFELV